MAKKKTPNTLRATFPISYPVLRRTTTLSPRSKQCRGPPRPFDISPRTQHLSSTPHFPSNNSPHPSICNSKGLEEDSSRRLTAAILLLITHQGEYHCGQDPCFFLFWWYWGLKSEPLHWATDPVLLFFEAGSHYIDPECWNYRPGSQGSAVGPCLITCGTLSQSQPLQVFFCL